MEAMNVAGAPFRGPEPFRFVDADIFRARDAEKRAILQTITIYRGLLIYGEQAAGKSSLVNAALIPGLLERGYAVERLLFRPEGEAHLVLDRISRGGDGEPYLPSLFDSEDGVARVPFTAGDFERRLRGITERPAAPTPVLVFDQFEELITLAGPSGTNAAADAVVALLIRLFFDQTLPVKLVLVFREDYLAKISDRLAGAPDLLMQRYWVRPPPKSAAHEIITGPFDPERARTPYPRGPFTPELVDSLALELEAHRQSDRLSLTDLQIACLELWEAGESAARLLGELHVQGLIQRYFNRALDALSGAHLREPAVALLTYMVTPYGTRNVISKEDLIGRVRESENTPFEVLDRALQALVKTRLVRHDLQHNAEYYEVVSEYLAPWIAHQRRLRDAQIARRRTEQRLRSTRYATTAISALILTISIAVTVYSVLQLRQDAVRRELEAAVAQLTALEGVVTATQTERDRAEQLASALAQRTSAAIPQKGSTMFGSTILEIGIGLALLYALLSLICTVLNELMAAWLDWRARHLIEGLRQLLGDLELVDTLYAHPLIRGLAASERMPSYIPSNTFAYALLDTLAPGQSSSIDALRSSLLEMKSRDTSRALLLLQERGPYIEDFSRNVERWFNDGMEAVAGAYRRRTQWRLLALAGLLTVALNVDTLNVLNRLSTDPAVRDSLVAQTQVMAASSPTGPSAAASSPTESSAEPSTSSLDRTLSTLRSLGMPIGWTGANASRWSDDTGRFRVKLLAFQILGWILTALAVSLGAPFCFDLLNKVMVVRSTVKPREKSSEQPTKV